MKRTKLDATEINICKDSIVTVAKMGLVTEIQFMSFMNTEPKIKKINEKEYVVVETGEIKPFEKKAETRDETLNSLRKTMKKIRELITTNVVDPDKIRWVTITYRENVRDTKKLYNDFRKFHQRFRYHLEKNGIEIPEYIAIAEPQLRGAWHLHVLYIWQIQSAPFIPNSEFSKLWGLGFTKVKALDKNNFDVGSYLCAYLQDLELDEESSTYFPDDPKTIKTVSNPHGKEKRIAKGMRMYLYPAKMNIFRDRKSVV